MENKQNQLNMSEQKSEAHLKPKNNGNQNAQYIMGLYVVCMLLLVVFSFSVALPLILALRCSALTFALCQFS